ncbi:TRAF3-interacting protein 1-like isoform X1 [Asterias rubens]|uniref:TRAF3-interacting protein 1-like isoform X1 n=1 Tax=Asterias rubens TaxID=7604 RepID=UPI001455AC86|nr:TRAF3-interacting protein 1-like isoform X1 [Asterias rubens]
MGDFVKGTQDTLGKLIKKPPLTEKLLKKPPFRFLHDIITEVIRTTSFMKGLYTSTEMDSQNVKDKENKVAFLQKAIDVVAIVNKKPLSVKPSKIVAGHEPEKTNELLQEIARAISSKSDSSAAVAKVLGGDVNESESGKPPKPAKEDDKIRDSSADKRKRDKENRQEKKISSDNRDRSSSRDREKEKGKEKDHKDRNRSKDRERSKDKDREKDRDRSKDRDKERSKDKDRKGRDKDKEREKEHSRDKDKERDRERRERRKRKEEEEAARQQQQNAQEDEEDAKPSQGENEDGSSSNRIPRPTSAKGQRRRPMQGSDDSEGEEEVDGGGGQKLDQEKNNMVNGNDSLPPPASRKLPRPSSARPAPPRVKKQDAAEDPAMRIGSGKQNTNVIVDNGQNSEDEDDIFVVEDSTPAVEEDAMPIGSESLEDDGEHGGLVKKILETKKELEGNKMNNKKDDKPIVMDAARRKERERVQREVEKLSGAIQTLTRSANPLGKIMDYLQEDVDSMQKELEMWKKENQEHALAIKREQGITDAELEPLKAQLTELDQGIDDQLDTIATVKASILRNDDKTAKMLSSVAIS